MLFMSRSICGPGQGEREHGDAAVPGGRDGPSGQVHQGSLPCARGHTERILIPQGLPLMARPRMIDVRAGSLPRYARCIAKGLVRVFHERIVVLLTSLSYEEILWLIRSRDAEGAVKKLLEHLRDVLKNIERSTGMESGTNFPFGTG